MRRWSRGLLFWVLICLLSGLPLSAGEEAKEPGKCLLWKVGSKTGTAYLMGSIHVGDKRMYPLDPAIDNAFDNSDVLVVEMVPGDDLLETAMGLMRKGAYQGQETIEADLSPGAREKLTAALQKQGISLTQVKRMRPWYLGLMLVMGELKRLGYGETGVDFYFMERAPAQQKKTIGLETLEEQSELLAGGTKEEQELALLDTLERLPDMEGMMNEMVEAWLAGDADGLDRVVRENLSKDPRLQPYHRRLFGDRNVRMAAKIEEYLKGDKTYFVVVGSGHLVGDEGIVKLLRGKGYSVVQVDKAAGKQPGKPLQRPAESDAPQKSPAEPVAGPAGP